MSLTTDIFVYGSLMSGFWNHDLLLGRRGVPSRSMDSCFEMRSASAFPFLFRVPEEGSKVVGEVYRIPVDALDRLDRLEGHPSFYMRSKMRFLLEGDCIRNAWVYLTQDQGLRDRSTLVSDCDWRGWTRRTTAEHARG